MNRSILIERAARELLDKLHAAGKAIDFAIQIATLHHCPYTGPTYGQEMGRLEYALALPSDDGEAVPVVWISDTATYSLHENGTRAMGTWSSTKYRDFTTPLYAHPAPRVDAQETHKSALQKFNESFDEAFKMSAFDRLKFFSSCAMNGPDWIDSEPFFDAVEQETERLRAALAELVSVHDHFFEYMEHLRIHGSPPGKTEGMSAIDYANQKTTKALAAARAALSAEGGEG